MRSLLGDMTTPYHSGEKDIVQGSKSYSSFVGHQDWVRSVSVSVSDQHAVSGDTKSVVWAWDIPSAQALNMLVLPQYSDVELNVVMALEFHPQQPHIFYALQRSGHLNLCDIRTPSMHQWHACVHRYRASSLRLCHYSETMATSARGNEIKLWDWRGGSKPNAVDQYVQIYKQHESQKAALGFDFLVDEQFLVTGSDSFYVHIYNTLSGVLLKTVRIAPGPVMNIIAFARSNLNFYAIYRNGQSFGLVDTEGPSIVHKFTNSEEIKALYSREAWEKTIFRNIDRLIEAARMVQSDIPVSYEHIMPIVRGSDLPICKTLIQELDAEYEVNIKVSTPNFVRDIQAFYRKAKDSMEPAERQRTAAEAGWARVSAERTSVKTDQARCYIP